MQDRTDPVVVRQDIHSHCRIKMVVRSALQGVVTRRLDREPVLTSTMREAVEKFSRVTCLFHFLRLVLD